MKILTIGCTHGFHRTIEIPTDIDCIVHCGDSTHYKELYRNEIEFEDFLDWYSKLDVKYKILIAGNHDTWATKKYNKDKVKEAGVIYLEHEYYEIEGVKFFGSPYTPIFGDWNFMIDRSKLSRYWEQIPLDVDIAIVHGPVKGILDLSHNREGKLEYCGCSALRQRMGIVQPKYFISSHIHDSRGCSNYGIRTTNDYTTYINCSMVYDGKFDKGIVHSGIIINF